MAEPVSVTATAGIVAGAIAMMEGVKLLIPFMRRNGKEPKLPPNGSPCRKHVQTCERLAKCEADMVNVVKRVDDGFKRMDGQFDRVFDLMADKK